MAQAEAAAVRIGVDLGGSKIEAIALDAEGRELARRRVGTPRGDYMATLDAVVSLVLGIEADCGPADTIGLGMPGAISPATGLVKNANSVWLNDRRLDSDLARRLDRPLRVANDADCFALSEAIDGAGMGAASVFGVILGTGVGGGIVLHGRLLAGPNAIAGEWGHNPLPWPRDDERPGPRCHCGREGCTETFLSGPGLARDHEAAGGAVLSPAEIDALARDGDTLAEATLSRYEDRLARALATVINVVDPGIIVLGGGLSNLTRLVENVPGLWADYVFSDRVDTRLVAAAHGDSGGVRGAAWLWPTNDSA